MNLLRIMLQQLAKIIGVYRSAMINITLIRLVVSETKKADREQQQYDKDISFHV